MTEGGVEPGTLPERLPEEWRVEVGDGGAHGCADAGGDVGHGEVAACFTMHRDGDLWVATWKDAHELGIDPRSVSHRVTGTRERCVEWVVSRALAVEGDDGG